MGCPSSDELVRIALEPTGHEAHAEHLRQCARCRSELESLRALVARLAAAHDRFEQGHDEARERLLSLLPESRPRTVPASPWNTISSWIGALTMRQRLALGSAGGLIVLALWLFSPGILVRPAYAMAQVAESIRRATSYEFQMTYEMELPGPPGKPATKGEMGGRFAWKAPGSYRIEHRAKTGPMEQDQVTIAPAGKPGIDLDLKAKKYTRRPVERGEKSPLMMVEKLGNYSGQADEDLGTKTIDGQAARGFRIRGQKIDPDIPTGTVVDVWVDRRTNLPLFVSMAMKDTFPPGTIRMSGFRWNADLDPKLFDTTPPEGFTEIVRTVPGREEQVRTIAEGLKLYAKYAGHYPRVKMLYGDSTRDEFVRLSGAPYPPRKPEDQKDTRLGEVYVAIRGFATINGLQRENPDAAYHGKSVGPADKDKVLLRWKLDDGTYQVLYGDLRSEVVPADRLRQLESQ